MNGIMGMSNMLSRTELNPTQRKYLSLIQLSSDKLLGIINEILDFSKIEAGRVDLISTEFKVDKFIEELVMLSQNYASEKGLELTYAINSCDSNILKGDIDKLRQILLNLIQNAIKFTDTGYVKVVVSGQRVATDKCLTRFEVHDSGIGIKKEDQEQLFKPFYQLDSSTTKKYEGTGLGLAIVKRLVEMLQGQVLIESEQGAGSTFIVEIPFEIPAYAQQLPGSEFTGEAVPVTNSNEVKTLLVVEDNAINRMHLVLLLGDEGFEVKEASNGQDALEMFRANSIDLVVIDGQMPVMDGFMAVRQMREIEKERIGHVPIIALSGYTNTSDKDKFYAAGVDDFVSKPIIEADLIEKINNLLKGSV
jgi:CheY-like chemotaxis protein